MNIYNQLFSLSIFTCTGIIIGVLFDIFRIIRKTFKTPDFITYIEDIIFWILTGFILLFTIFIFNNGEIRIYIFIGLILGIILYALTLSKFLINICVNILNVIKRIIEVPVNIIINIMKKTVFRAIKFLFSNIKNILQKITIIFKKETKKTNITDIGK